MTREEHIFNLECIGYDGWTVTTEAYESLQWAIKELKQEPKTGHWNCGDDMFEYAICSSCKHETGEAWEYAKRNFKYCPNCGSKMEDVEGEI